MYRIYHIKLLFRIGVFLAGLTVYLRDPTSLAVFWKADGWFHGVTSLQIVWLILMGELGLKFWARAKLSIGSRKHLRSFYIPSETFPAAEEIVLWKQRENQAAWKVLIVWLGGNSIPALLYWGKLWGTPEMILLSLFYYVWDLVCVLFYCPVQVLLMKNRCCVTCRIFNWDAMMICTPLLVIPGFFSWSLIAVALGLLVGWEYSYWKYPERFFEASNANLQCRGCQERLCRNKKPLPLQHTNSRVG